MSVLIKGGRIVTASDDYVGDIYAENGTVTVIGQSLDMDADKVIDAGGKYVIPGDRPAHAHRDVLRGTTTCDDFTSGTVAAASADDLLVDFVRRRPGRRSRRRSRTTSRRSIAVAGDDVGLHGVTDRRAAGARGAGEVARRGDHPYKLFMAYKGAVMVDDETLFKTMQVAHDTGGS
jgi:dihydropyrimidinase